MFFGRSNDATPSLPHVVTPEVQTLSLFRNYSAVWENVNVSKLCEGSLKADSDDTTFAYDCRMRFLERALFASCTKSHTTLVTQHCLNPRQSLAKVVPSKSTLKDFKGRFTRYDFVARDKLMTGLRHELFRVNQTYNSLTTVVYVTKNVVGF